MFNQEQTEGLILLMLGARFQDGKLSLAESEAFEKQLAILPWDSGSTLGIFLQGATGKVRRALDSKETKQKLFQEQFALFTDAETQNAAIDSLSAVLEADGIDPREMHLIADMRAAFGQ